MKSRLYELVEYKHPSYEHRKAIIYEVHSTHYNIRFLDDNTTTSVRFYDDELVFLETPEFRRWVTHYITYKLKEKLEKEMNKNGERK
jgi:hypothetical protein